jgi:hypothetical protein
LLIKVICSLADRKRTGRPDASETSRRLSVAHVGMLAYPIFISTICVTSPGLVLLKQQPQDD